ncbi:30S ribosomal protein S1 [Luteitalea sp. TBR-22]|uniref:30S ribosomal protein S1 n=1 Tax=Luteitalea sp. TBR-22 TaxID=2802971 RepID=UPI001AF6E7D2|nr:S1 RNA-binding domain-containing protein [Luteitalea sp. TBR-22]BCS35539.1 30S ribosomal protein S1 [Luteitalea sp. TBR-22]
MTEPEDFHPEDDFAALFEASQRASRFTKGQAIEGTVVGIGDEVALIDVGGKSEAVVPTAELKDDQGTLEVAVGDRIQAVVIDTAGGITLSRKLARKAATDKELAEAWHARLPVEGTVQGVIKGGYEVKVARSRAFCPFSQIDVIRTENPEVHVGRAYVFRITEFRDEGRSIVVSRRAILEEEQAARAEEVRKTIVPGAVLGGRVASVRDFGAFVDLGGGVQGLLHVSEMGWSRIADASQAGLKAGDDITVKVLRVDETSGKISLGLKQLLEDPWVKAGESFAVGQVVPGRITRLAEFGAFVEIAPGIEALAHASTFPPGQRGAWRRTVQAGQAGHFQVLTVEPDKKRIGVTLVAEGTTTASLAADAADDAAALARATAAPSGGLGSLADKLRDALKGR